MDILLFLAIILLLGTLCSVIALKLRFSSIPFLLAMGVILRFFYKQEISQNVLIVVSGIALILIIFGSISKFKIKDIMKFAKTLLKVLTIFFFLNMVFLSIATSYLFSISSIALVLFFSALMYGSDPSVTLSVLDGKKTKVVKFLSLESILSTPITIIISLAFLNLLLGKGEISYAGIGAGIFPFIAQFAFAIIIGVVSGSFVVLILNRTDLGELTYVVLFAMALLTYSATEVLGGSGVLAITIFALIFGNYHIHKKSEYNKFTMIFSDILYILVYIILGSLLVFPTEVVFVLKSILLFIIYLIIRFASMLISLKGFSMKEKIFMSLNVAKGIDAAVVVLLVISGIYLQIGGMQKIISISMLFIIYSIILSVLVSRFGKGLYFTKKQRD